MAVKKFKVISAQDLLSMPVKAVEFIVEDILAPGLVILAGDPKIGKSWFVLLLAYCVANGIEFLRHATRKAGVLYLALEDPESRAQARLQRIADECDNLLYFALEAEKIQEGLVEQIEMYVKDYPETKLVIVDTLQKVRTPSKGNAYAVDYEDLGALKRCADNVGLCILLVHHTRKMSDDSNPFNRVSGSNGIMGVADETMMLTRPDVMQGKATLTITGRDVSASEYELKMTDCRWELVSQVTEEELCEREIPPVVLKALDYIKAKGEDWEGTVTDFIEVAGLDDAKPNTLTKLLNEHRDFLEERGIRYGYRRTPEARLFSLTHIASIGDSDA